MTRYFHVTSSMSASLCRPLFESHMDDVIKWIDLFDVPVSLASVTIDSKSIAIKRYSERTSPFWKFLFYLPRSWELNSSRFNSSLACYFGWSFFMVTFVYLLFMHVINISPVCYLFRKIGGVTIFSFRICMDLIYLFVGIWI